MTGLVFDGLTYNAGVLCWKSDCLLNNPVTRIQRAASGGFNIHTYYQPATCGGLRVRSRNIALDANRRVYWATGDGRIATLPQDAVPGTAPTILASLENNTAASVFVAVSRDYVYWAESFGELLDSGKIFRAPIAGGARSELFSLPSGGGGGASWLAATTLDTNPGIAPTEVVYFRRSFGPLVKSWLRIVVPWTTDIVAASVQGVAVANGRLWFAESNASGASAIRSLPMNNSLVTTLHSNVVQTGTPQIWSLAADESAVYWHETRGGSGPIMRRYLFGGATAEPISGNLPPMPIQTGLLSDGRHLMWGAGGGASQTVIKRLPVSTAAVKWNLSADALELVQAIQNPSHSVPLVARKPGWVRLTGRIESNNTGETSIIAGASLRGSVNGVELPGSPLTPEMGSHRVYLTPHDRYSQQDGWWFRIPESWMQNELRLRATVNPEGAIIETTREDNEVSRNFVMEERKKITIWMHPLRTHQGVIDRWKPEYQAIEDLTEALLPTPELNIMFAGGPVIEEWQGIPFPWSFGPYELSDSDNDSDWVFAKLFYRMTVFTIPDLLTSGRVHHGAFFQPAAGQKFLGKGLYHANILISGMNLGGNTLNRPAGALTLAHELAHNFNRRHVNCGNPKDLDASYPYPPCGLDVTQDGSSFMGFNPVARSLVASRGAADLMSYGSSRWTSDHTWKALYERLNPGPAAAPLPGAPDSLPALTGRKLLVVGEIDPSRAGRLEPALLLPDAESVARAASMLADAADHTTYQVRVFGSGNTLLGTAAASNFPGSEEGAIPVFALIDEDDAAERIELVATAQPAVSLATSEGGGGGAPTVQITQPGASLVAGETLAVRWTATDPDGDPLRFAVRYSQDAGASWRLLAEDLRIGELDVPMSGLPGGPAGNALLEVMATDGLRTGSARSALFTVLPRAPEIRAFIETPEQRHCPTPNPALRPGAFFTLHGAGQDAEDGPLPEEAFGWSLAGPRTLTGTGRTFSPAQLPPGSYLATLSAADSGGLASQAELPFIISPLRIEDVATTPVLDGVPDLRATPPLGAAIPIPYPAGRAATVSMSRNGAFVYITVAGIPADPLALQRVVVSADTDFAGEAAPTDDDIRFIAGADGTLATERGNGVGFVRDAAPFGFTARTSSNDGVWHAEMRISLSRLGAWDGRSIRLDVAIDGRRWFNGEMAGANIPAQWAVVELAPDVNPSYDGDGDGLPDAWERLHFGGSLSQDGNGDLDGDGQSNAMEYLAGTDPSLATSRFAISGHGLAGEIMEVRWQSIPGHCYDVEASTDLVKFTTVAANLPATGGEMTYEVPVQANSSSAQRIFCRIRVQRLVP